MNDHLIKATANGIRAFAAVTTNLVREGAERHKCLPIAAAALGRTMTGALLLAANLKTKECVTLSLEGNGALRRVVADASADGIVRGYVENPNVDLPLKNGKLAVGDALGIGLISVTRFTDLKQPFTGRAELVSGEIAEDLTNYLLVSEQTPSSVGLGVLVGRDLSVEAAGGFFIQALPDVSDEALDKLEANLKTLRPVSAMVKEGIDAKGIIAEIFKGMDVNYFAPAPLEFKCNCSKEKIEKVLLSVGETELNALIEKGEAEVVCHFCGDKYNFSKEELEKLLDEVKK
jgi:molecular chaperone Hsp33